MYSRSTCQITEQNACDLDTTTKKQPTTTSAPIGATQTENCTYVAVAECNIASPDGILARPSTASDEIKAAYGSRQSFKTCNGADELAVGTSAS